MSDVNWIKEIFESWWLLLKRFTSLLPLKQQVLHQSVSTFYPWNDKVEKLALFFVKHSFVSTFLRKKVGEGGREGPFLALDKKCKTLFIWDLYFGFWNNLNKM